LLVAGGHTGYTQSGNGFLATGVHSIMMEKLAQAGEGESSRPPPYTLFTIAYKVYQIYSPYFISTAMYSVAGGVNGTVTDFFVDISDQNSVNYVTDNSDIFVASVGYTHRKKRIIYRKNWEQFVACINDIGDQFVASVDGNYSYKKTFFKTP
jgi:hypothetical protein